MTDNTNEENINKDTNQTTTKENIPPVKMSIVYNYSSPAIKWDDNKETIYLPSDNWNNFTSIAEKVPKLEITNDEWLEVVKNGRLVETFNSIFSEPLNNPNNDFKPYVEVGNNKLKAKKVSIKEKNDQVLTGDIAVNYVLNKTGKGGLFSTALWHSGIWLIFKTPSEIDIINLHKSLIDRKIQLGRKTYGLVFSNSSYFIIERLLKFAMDNIYYSSVVLPKGDYSALLDLIPIQDINLILHGLICAMYPNGFQYSRACINNPESCTYVLKEILKLDELLHTDNSRLTEWQKNHMLSIRESSKSIEDIKRYQDELLPIQSRTIKINLDTDSELSIVLKTSKLSDYILSGQRWIQGITEFIDKNLTVTIDEDKDSLITSYGKATFLREYGHWVQSLQIDSNTIEDQETIEKVLDKLSSEDTIRNTIIEGIINYINNSTISIPGIPVFECPMCKTTNTTNININYKNIIPLEMIQIFFILSYQRRRMIMER